MKLNTRTITLILFLIAIIIALSIAILIPSKTPITNLDFNINDSNQNYKYEVNEELEFLVTNFNEYKDREVVWHLGNGDTLKRTKNVNYTYKKNGKYMVTLAVDSNYKISKYIDVVTLDNNSVNDSISKIKGPDFGFVGEELVFSSDSPGVNSWFWEFGETGTVDAYERQVVYVYEKEGIYEVKLKTNTSQYPVSHQIIISNVFDDVPPVDSLSLVQEDIKEKLQIIADASSTDKKSYYDSLKHIEDSYTCNDADEVVVVINETKYNDLYSYCQGLHYLQGKGAKTVVINEVVIDAFNCLKRIEVKQSIINK